MRRLRVFSSRLRPLPVLLALSAFCAFLACASGGVSPVGTGSSPVGTYSSPVGTYKACPFHCQILELRPDHRFELRLSGDLYSGESTSGVWEQNGRFIELTSDAGPCLEWRESVEGLNGSVAVTVVDQVGEPYPGAEVLVRGERLEGRFTDIEGRAELSMTPPVERVSAHAGGTGDCSFTPSSEQSDTFTLVLDTDALPELEQQRYFLTGDGIVPVDGPLLERQ